MAEYFTKFLDSDGNHRAGSDHSMIIRGLKTDRGAVRRSDRASRGRKYHVYNTGGKIYDESGWREVHSKHTALKNKMK